MLAGAQMAFATYAATFNKSYQTIEHHQAGFEAYAENLKTIERHNQKALGFTLGVNQFTDLNEAEFLRRFAMQGDHPMLTDRPHKSFEGSPVGRFEGDRTNAELNGYDLNNYKWLDSQAKCAA